MIKHKPLCVVNRRNDARNVVIHKSSIFSKWTALVEKHIKTAIQAFPLAICLMPLLTMIEHAKSIPMTVNNPFLE